MRNVRIEVDARRSWQSRLHVGLRDIVAGASRRELWMFLGWREVRKQYQRSVLGPFWLTLNMGVLVTALGFFYSQIFQQDIADFLPYVALGFIVWGLISGQILEACTVFTSAATSVRQSYLPFSVYAYQLVWRQLMIFFHNCAIFVVVALIFGIWPGMTGLLALPGIAIILVAGFGLALILGPLSARFRDIPPITASVTQIFFFLTPIIWTPASVPERATFVLYNPFYHFVAIVREPLLGHAPTGTNWIVTISLTGLFAVVAVLFFSRLRSRIPYWA